MQTSASQARISQTLAVVAIAAVSLLLAFAARAQGETIEETAAPQASGAESLASTVEGAAAPSPEETAAEVPLPAAAEESTEPPPQGEPLSAIEPTSAAATSEAPAAAGVVAAAGERASELVETVGQDSAKAVAVVTEPTGTKVAETVGKAGNLDGHTRAVGAPLTSGPPKPSDATAPSASPVLLAPASQGRAKSPSGGGRPMMGGLLRPRAGAADTPLSRYLGFAGVDRVRPAAVLTLFAGIPAAPTSSALGAAPHASAERPSRPSPLDAPTQPKPSGAAPGSGPSFVPLAALLALLALAVPAILRRLEGGPDPHAPTPFVCALERPG